MVRIGQIFGMTDGRKEDRLRLAILAFAAGFVVLLLALEIVVLWLQRNEAVTAAEQRVQSYARILAAHMERTVGAVDAALKQLTIEARRIGGPAGPDSEWLPVLNAAYAGTPGIGSISVVDDKGIIRHAMVTKILGQSRASDYLFQTLARDPKAELVISKPFKGLIDGGILLPLGRRLSKADGSFAGAVVATIVPARLREFYRSVDLSGGLVRIIHPSGIILFAEPSAANPMGEDATHGPVFKAYQTGAREGVIHARLAPEGPTMINGFATTAAPELVVAVSLDEAQALAPWWSSLWLVAGATIGLILALAGATAMLLRELGARARAEQNLAERDRALAQAQKMEAIGQLTGGIAHDFNNLLTVIAGSIERLRDLLPEPPKGASDAMRLIDLATERAGNLTASLLAFARRQTLQPQLRDLNLIVTGMDDLLRRSLGETVQISLVLNPEPCVVLVDAAQVETAILNLCINARDAMPRGGRLTIETGHVTLDGSYAQFNPEVAPGRYAMLAVTDSGTGMSPDIVERAFEPFFTTKETGKGSGLGLSMVFGFVKQSNGHIKIYSELGRGTAVKIYLPLQASISGEQPVVEARPAPSGGETILLVEDDAQVRNVVHGMLTRLGYKVILADSGASALSTLKVARVDMILSDVVLDAQMSGPELIVAVRRLEPEMKALFMSGYPRGAAHHNGGLHNTAPLLQKPFRAADLATKIREILDKA